MALLIFVYYFCNKAAIVYVVSYYCKCECECSHQVYAGGMTNLLQCTAFYRISLCLQCGCENLDLRETALSSASGGKHSLATPIGF